MRTARIWTRACIVAGLTVTGLLPISHVAAQTTTAPASQPDRSSAASLGTRIAAAHGRPAWSKHAAVQVDIEVDFGGERMLTGTMLYDHHDGRVRIDTTDGTLLVFDGKTAWVAPADSEVAGARFALLTWPYFLAAPFKLDDPGTQLEDTGSRMLHDQPHATARLTFDGGVGDTPEDWYVIYADPATSELRAMAYIVTFGKSAGEAEKEPHAVTYEEYDEIHGAKLSRRWRFWNWSEEKGVFGEQIGEARLLDIAFVRPEDGVFDKPEGAREAPLPAPTQAAATRPATSQPAAAGAVPPAIKTAKSEGWSHYGFDGRDTGPAVKLAALRGDEANVVITGTISDVCEKKGCWMRVQDGGQELFVRFQDYAFFVPRNAAEHRVVMHGTAIKQISSVEELRHYAEDAGKSPEEIAAITEPEERLTFYADSVYIAGEGLDEPHSQ